MLVSTAFTVLTFSSLPAQDSNSIRLNVTNDCDQRLFLVSLLPREKANGEMVLVEEQPIILRRGSSSVDTKPGDWWRIFQVDGNESIEKELVKLKQNHISLLDQLKKSSTSPELSDAKDALEQLNAQLEASEKDEGRVANEYNEFFSRLNAMFAQDTEKKTAAYEQMRVEFDRALEEWRPKGDRLGALSREYNAIVGPLNDGTQQATAEIEEKLRTINSEISELELARKPVDDLNEKLKVARKDLDQALADVDEKRKAQESNIKAWREALEQAKARSEPLRTKQVTLAKKVENLSRGSKQ